MKVKTIWIFILFLAIQYSVFSQETEFIGTLTNSPAATRQLGPAIFFSQNILTGLVKEEGDVILVLYSGKVLELRAYMFFGKDSTFGMYNEYAEYFDFKKGNTYKLKIKQCDKKNSKLNPKRVEFKVVNYKGDTEKWKGIAIAAPHGDCDNETGEVIKIVAEKYGIPATAAYGCRLSYRGIWFDCNRPLMKKPKKNNKGVIPSRVWNAKAEEIYSIYQDSVWSNSNLKYGERFKLFTSFHGHDLTVKLPSGEKIQRPVIEGMGVGFTKNELRRIKKFYNKNKNKYYKNPPALYFGNLPEDRTYYYEGVPLTFFYSGLGTRTYGSLRSDLVENALHFETPNSMRFDPKIRPKTAEFIFDIYGFIIDSVFTKRKLSKTKPTVKEPEYFNKKQEISAGEFLMGAPNNIGWSSEHPQHKVFVDKFSIDIYEVTNKQFVEFLNTAYKDGLIKIIDGIVVDAGNIDHNICITKINSPFSEIIYKRNSFSVEKGREYFPVIYVSYYGALMYARLNNSRLPTEAEWEKAASRVDTGKFIIPREKLANYEDSCDPYENIFPGTTPVGYFSNCSVNNTFDMNGNVWEWCADNYDYNYFKHETGNESNNPKGPEKSSMKVIKGGAWNTEYNVIRNTMRLGINPNQMLCNVGFRCVKIGNK